MTTTEILGELKIIQLGVEGDRNTYENIGALIRKMTDTK